MNSGRLDILFLRWCNWRNGHVLIVGILTPLTATKRTN